MTIGVSQMPPPRDQGDARRKPAEFTDGDLLVKMIREDLLAHRILILSVYLKKLDIKMNCFLQRFLMAQLELGCRQKRVI